MKILFCLQCRIRQTYGGARVALGLAEAMRGLGWECDVVSIPEIHAERSHAPETMPAMRESFRAYLREKARHYDVVDYDYNYLPYSRAEFAPATLLVARSVLLHEHFPHVRFRTHRKIRRFFGNLLRGRAQETDIVATRTTLDQADLINVANEDDRTRLIETGIAPGKIAVIPFGIWWNQWPPASPSKEGESPTLVFVGSFDYRKGCLDLVDFARIVLTQVPDSRLRLIGTKGMVQTEEGVRAYFPRKFHTRIDVLPRFQPEELPGLLRGATLGVFPSYLEGFGMAVVEMVASGIPVLAYRVPGPASILPPSCLVERGDVGGLARRALEWLGDAHERNRRAVECAEKCREFDWALIGRTTSDLYLDALKALRA